MTKRPLALAAAALLLPAIAACAVVGAGQVCSFKHVLRCAAYLVDVLQQHPIVACAVAMSAPSSTARTQFS